MRQFLVATSLALMVSIGLLCAPLGAKPADLPADDKIQCPQGQEKGAHGGIAIDLDALSGGLAAPGGIDTINPMLIEALLEQWLDAVAKLLPTAADPRAQQARQAYEAAERARRAGDYVQARTSYQQVHLLAPTSRLGRLAIDRIIEIEQRLRDASEEAEPAVPNPAPRPLRRGSRDGYEPLGLVEVTY
jgi:hypothetical protein